MKSAPNRDDYVGIVYENIIPSFEGNFKKYDRDLIEDFGVECDYGSIMSCMYRSLISRQKTIVKKL